MKALLITALLMFPAAALAGDWYYVDEYSVLNGQPASEYCLRIPVAPEVVAEEELGVYRVESSTDHRDGWTLKKITAPSGVAFWFTSTHDGCTSVARGMLLLQRATASN